MNNVDVCDRLQQAHSARIEKMFWAAGCLESTDFKDFLSEIDERDFKEMLPEVYEDENYNSFREDGELVQLLMEHNKYGIFVEAYVPNCDGFKYDKKGKPISWSVHEGWCRIVHAYGETLEEILVWIEKQAEICFKDSIARDKKSKKNKKKDGTKIGN